jgi:hypothetical protein
VLPVSILWKRCATNNCETQRAFGHAETQRYEAQRYEAQRYEAQRYEAQRAFGHAETQRTARKFPGDKRTSAK